MKKLLLGVALMVATLTFTSFTPRVNTGNAPAEIKAFVTNMSSSIQNEVQEEGVIYEGVDVQGHNIICTFALDESQFGGMSLTQAFQAGGIDINMFKEQIKEFMISTVRMDPNGEEDIRILREYEYNLIIRYKGNISGDKIDARIGYNEW